MTFLFSRRALETLRLQCHTDVLFAFDFDGTLARIVKKPDAAKMHPSTEKLLKELSGIAPVAVISGRGARDLSSRLGFSPQFVVGNHGLESGQNAYLKKAEKLCRGWVRQLKTAGLPPGVWIENKKYSLSIHFRGCKKAAKLKVLEMAAQLSPAPRLVKGKAVLNVVAKNAPDKGTALLKLMRDAGLRCAIYIGDDETDEDVFRVNRKGMKILKVRVGKKKSSKAEYFIKGQKDINLVLSTLLSQTRT